MQFRRTLRAPRPVMKMADGGLVSTLRNAVFGSRPAPQLGGMNMDAMQRREAAAGLLAPAPAAPPNATPGNPSGIRFAHGGMVRGPGTGTSDSIDAKLSNGEAVLPADTVRAIGPENVEQLIASTHTPVNTPKSGLRNHFANGMVDRIPKDQEMRAPAADGSQDDPMNNELGRNLTALSASIPVPGLSSSVRSASRLGAMLGASNTIAAVAPYAVPAAGATALYQGTNPSAPTPARPPAAPSAPNPTDQRLAASTQTAAPQADTGGLRRINGGSSPLFTNVPDAGMGGNDALMGRGSISAQNQGAAQALSDRYQGAAQATAQQMINNEQVARESGGGLRGQLERQLAGKTLNRNGAALVQALDSNDITSRGQNLTYDATVRGQDMTSASTRAGLRYNMAKDQRDFAVGRSDKAFDQDKIRQDQRQQGIKNINDEFAGMLPPILVDGKPTADSQTAARYSQALTAQMGAVQTDLEKRVAAGDKGAAVQLRKLMDEGVGGLDAKDKKAFFASMRATDASAQAGTGVLNPFGGTTVQSDVPVTSLRKNNDSLFGFGGTYSTNRAGERIPARNVERANGDFVGGVRRQDLDSLIQK